MTHAARSTRKQPPTAAELDARARGAPRVAKGSARSAAQSARATAHIVRLRGIHNRKTPRAGHGPLGRGARLGCVAACLASALLAAGCGTEAAPWTAFSSFDLDAGTIDFGSWRPPVTGARRAGANMDGAGAPATPDVATGTPASTNSAGASGAAGSDAGEAMRGDASAAADGGTGGSAGSRTDDGRRRGPFGGWDGGWFPRGEPPRAGSSGAADRADAGDGGTVDAAEPRTDVDTDDAGAP